MIFDDFLDLWFPLAPFGSLLAPFGSLLAPFWFPLAPFWLPLAPFWLSLAPLGSLLAPFGSLLAPFGFAAPYFVTLPCAMPHKACGAPFWLRFALPYLTLCHTVSSCFVISLLTVPPDTPERGGNFKAGVGGG